MTIRRYLEQFSRKTCPISQLTDVMNRLLECSNPLILHRKEIILQKMTDIICLECGSQRHTTTRQHAKVERDKTWYDILMETFIM